MIWEVNYTDDAEQDLRNIYEHTSEPLLNALGTH